MTVLVASYHHSTAVGGQIGPETASPNSTYLVASRTRHFHIRLARRRQDLVHTPARHHVTDQKSTTPAGMPHLGTDVHDAE